MLLPSTSRGDATALLLDGATAGHEEQNEPAVLADAFDTALLVLVERYRTARQFAPQRLLRSAYLRLLCPEGLGRIDRLRPGRDGGRTGE
ncbi:MAG: hypothetical protein L0I24_02715 [Pseudonocardia sp.]|nr:hypothetical protein [Pseudonocardia sp.]